MTTDQTDTGIDSSVLERNLAKIESLSQRLVAALSQQRQVNTALQGPGPELYAKAAAAAWQDMMANPSKVFEQQVSYWGKTLKHYIESQQELAKGSLAPPEDTTDDPRFSSPLWKTNPYFNYIKQQYLFSSEAIGKAVTEVEGMDAEEKKRLQYFSRQILDLMSPTNFLATNPEALERAVETDGQSLVDGLENLVRDLEDHGGDLVVNLADKSAFKLGENIAATEGEVVYRNRMFELIQYAPKTEQHHKTPLIIFPPWINKFYILDLKPQNSLIKWITEQGYTLFVVSWVNPDASYADVGLEDYIEEGYLTAINEVKAITGEKQVNAIGYCIAGTTLSLTLALLKQRGDKSIKSATFFTTLTDFSDKGEFGVFLTDDFLDGIEAEVAEHGYLDSFYMARTFSFLRSNDLIYKPAIRSYMMGQTPPAFDLLYWNGDGTNLPARMAVQYLRDLCQNDRLARGEIELFGTKLSLDDIEVPVCFIACETDHIAAWKSSYAGARKFASKEKTFILSQSGHIAGIVNPPSKKKYGHYTNPDMPADPDDWREGADFSEGSWWPRWEGWLRKRSGAKIKARTPGDDDHPALAKAPGTYVKPGK